MITTAELVNLIHMRSRRTMPLVTDIDIWQDYVVYSIGSRRYKASRTLEVLEVADGKSFRSNHSLYQQGVLRGGVRDDNGTLTIPTKDLW